MREAIIVARDQGVRPQLAAALDWSLSPLLRTGRAEIAATFLGALTNSALANVGKWPGVGTARSRSVQRAHDLLGDQADSRIARGAAMNYDELAEYAICHREAE